MNPELITAVAKCQAILDKVDCCCVLVVQEPQTVDGIIVGNLPKEQLIDLLLDGAEILDRQLSSN